METRVYSWGDGRPWHSYAAYCRRHFGGRVRKIAVDAGLSCPNRDGTIGSEGCTFCDNRAFTPSYCSPRKSLTRQIDEGIAFHAARGRDEGLCLVYFQPFSNTHAPVARLRELYAEALAHPRISGLVIGTARPDTAFRRTPETPFCRCDFLRPGAEKRTRDAEKSEILSAFRI